MPQDTPIDDHDPYAVLAREHRLIERGLNVLSRICDESRRTNGLDTADVTQVIQFLRDLADRTKRDVRLHGLTSDHHHALVLARRLREAAARGGLDLILLAEVRRRYIEELGPHFAIEEEELLRPVEQVGRTDLVARTLREHDALRGHLAARGVLDPVGDGSGVGVGPDREVGQHGKTRDRHEDDRVPPPG
jgi:hemerythrin-like domain-containing protein